VAGQSSVPGLGGGSKANACNPSERMWGGADELMQYPCRKKKTAEARMQKTHRQLNNTQNTTSHRDRSNERGGGGVGDKTKRGDCIHKIGREGRNGRKRGSAGLPQPGGGSR